ncbi:MAG: hypothetical protein EOO45_07885 [Flavobacterium sp.]|nr:MAG: hypothetical protein EOO45_07885 [Flavobacterium sp.]
MKIWRFVVLVLSLVSCQTEGLIGKWQLKEHIGSNGAETFSTSIFNGTMLEFKADSSVVRDGVAGKYYLSHHNNRGHTENRLMLKFDDKEFHYLYDLNGKKLSCTPVADDFSIICDEGCSDIYYKNWFD